MTLPNARRPLLMEIPSLIRSPAAAVRFNYGMIRTRVFPSSKLVTYPL